MSELIDEQLDHWGPHTSNHILFHLGSATTEIRISSGYFTIQGYHILSPAFEGKKLSVLVGYDEDAANQLRENLIENIMAHLRRWDIENRRSAVIDLVSRIEKGDFLIAEQRTEEIVDLRVRKGDHSKVYIVDDSRVIVGSANLTRSGLVNNTESITVVNDPEQVRFWVETFDTLWNAPNTRDLTQDLLAALKRWLELNPPFDVYLKTIQALDPEDKTVAPRVDYKMPVAFQQVIIERALRQLTKWRGAFVVASTGLGKTIIATHVALRLRLDNEILNVLVFAPKPVRKNWRQALKSAGIAHEVFSIENLDQKVRGNRVLKDMEDALTLVDDKHLIIIDESHRFRNRIVQGTVDQLRRSFSRIEAVNKSQNPMVLLLTATPYAKGIEDLNNQLSLLPKNAPPTNVDTNGQMVFEPWASDLIDTTTWRITDTTEFFEDFKSLPVCTVFSTSLVAKNYATQTDEGDYIDFGEERRWIPQVQISRIKVPTLLEKEIGHAIADGYFKHEMMSIPLRGGHFTRTDASIEKVAIISWTSSPLAIREVIDKTIQGVYDVRFIKNEKRRRAKLGPILEQLDNLSYEQDPKLRALLVLLDRTTKQGEKVIVFTERRATAIYIERAIASLLPDIKAASIVEQVQKGEYKLKEDAELEDIVVQFAPLSNPEQAALTKKRKSYDVLISTDAFSAGVNLQDASVVINYDLAWTPEIIIQRIGRILRFWSKPRKISCYTFVGGYHDTNIQKQITQDDGNRLNKLVKRTKHAQKFSELPIFPENETTTYTSLGALSNVTIEKLGVVDLPNLEDWSGVSPFLVHITALNKNLVRARQIPDDIMSALEFRHKNPRLFLLVRHNDTYFWPVYDVVQKKLIEVNEDDLLEMLRCDSEEPPADVDPHDIEQVAQEAKHLWIEAERIEHPESVERICALYLKPQGDLGIVNKTLMDQN